MTRIESWGLTPSSVRRGVFLAAALVASAAAAQSRVTFEQALPVINALPTNLPAGLRGLPPHRLARLWPAWVEQHDRDVRARLARGDEDSLVNFWLYGTSFTAHPPVVVRASRQSASSLDAIANARLEDLLDRVADPGVDERLQFARHVLTARNADPSAAGWRDRARRLLHGARQRMTSEFALAEQTLAAARPDGQGALSAANATIFRQRGLSSDTSVLSDYGVYVALETIARQETMASGSVRRVAVVGPGLDFTNKADGYDYYPQQTIQPFALVDALGRTGLAAADLRLATFDISTRVNDHLTHAAARAAASRGYVVTLALDAQEMWESSLLAYWRQWGSTIGVEVETRQPPPAAGDVRTRAIRVRPAVVSSVAPHDLNIVVDRLTLRADEQFDLVVATNVLFYYDVFEQALAAANVAAMLRPGGVFITNTAVLPTAPLRATASYVRVAHTAKRYDEIFWYQRAEKPEP